MPVVEYHVQMAYLPNDVIGIIDLILHIVLLCGNENACEDEARAARVCCAEIGHLSV